MNFYHIVQLRNQRPMGLTLGESVYFSEKRDVGSETDLERKKESEREKSFDERVCVKSQILTQAVFDRWRWFSVVLRTLFNWARFVICFLFQILLVLAVE